MTVFKRRFDDYLSMAKARCEWDALKFDPSTKKFHEFLDVLQKIAEEAFGSEAKQFIDKAIYAKMPDHVKKILNGAYLEDKPFNDIVLHLEREMRLNGLGAPDDVILVPLNKIEPAQTKTEIKPAQNTTQNIKKRYCFYCYMFGHFKAECQKMKRDKWHHTWRYNNQTKNNAGITLKGDTCGKPHKTEDCWNGANSANDPRPKRHFQQEKKRRIPPSNKRNPKQPKTQKTNYAAPALRETTDARAYSIEDPSTKHNNEVPTECNGTPTEDWLRRRAIATIKRHNAKHEQRRECPNWINDSEGQYMTTKKPLPESDQERICVFDKDYRCDPWDSPDLYDQSSLTFKEQPIAPVTDKNTNAFDEQSPSPLPKEDINGSTTKSIFPDHFPVSLNSIK